MTSTRLKARFNRSFHLSLASKKGWKTNVQYLNGRNAVFLFRILKGAFDRFSPIFHERNLLKIKRKLLPWIKDYLSLKKQKYATKALAVFKVIKVSNFPSKIVALYHVINEGIERQRHLAVFTNSNGALFRLTVVSPESMVARCILHKFSRI